MSSPLEIAHSEAGIQNAVDRIAHAEHPGFQVSPEIQIEDALSIIQSAVRAYMPEFRFNDTYKQNLTGGTPMHIHDAIAHSKPGLTVHHNEEMSEGGEAEMHLQLAKPDTTSSFTERFDLPNWRARVGKRYVGPLAAGSITVFSEGMENPDLGINVGPAFHGVKASGSVARTFTRYRFDPHHEFR